MRGFIPANIPCEAECKYCFAKWTDHNQQNDLKFESENFDTDQIILYPCCDGDYFKQSELIEIIKRYLESSQKVYISLSTKIKPTEEKLLELLDLHKCLVKENKGFVKIAISLSNRSMIDEVEPGTMSYEERINFAGYVRSLGFPLSLTLKPILPFIAKEEYELILNDFSPFLNHVMIGGLYVNKTSCFYANYIHKNYVCTKRKVTWLKNQPVWDYVEDNKLLEEIKITAHKLGMQVFESDLLVVKSMIEREK